MSRTLIYFFQGNRDGPDRGRMDGRGQVPPGRGPMDRGPMPPRDPWADDGRRDPRDMRDPRDAARDPFNRDRYPSQPYDDPYLRDRDRPPVPSDPYLDPYRRRPPDDYPPSMGFPPDPYKRGEH